MIALLPGESRALFPRLMDEMYGLRLGAAHAHAGRPSGAVHRLAVVDYFDSLDPLYVLALDETECVAGALRVLPTAGVTMLNDAFAGAAPDGIRVESPLIWEASRLTLRAAGDFRATDVASDRTIGQLGVALNAIAEAAALTHVIGVFDRSMHRLLSQRGCAGETLARSMRIDGADMCAVLYEVGAAMNAPFKSLAGATAPPINLADLEKLRQTGCRS
ncbi:autoinducer synthesis protein [Methylocystis sp. L43]|uniref:acyl-homoserine-lactone synthase n=1 Tax=unclassified Methylocystis TaxID=2625913 RepID=UPI0018C28E7B|nr:MULTISPECIES: acyl-homoserine-lactone synthase [unclassified Methylocystis]MBG0797860.1 autoinducer synthesis protein [Methylocystis sp. L43]MBG0805334.1 autoinducer synthesis protein [Methylocystis sp. H15]